MTWILTGGPPRSLVLVGREDPRAYGLSASQWGPAVEYLTPGDLAARFGVDAPELAPLSWRWVREDGGTVDDGVLGAVLLVDVTTGARVPLAEAPRLLGHAVTREGLGALGFVPAPMAPVAVSAVPASHRAAKGRLGLGQGPLRDALLEAATTLADAIQRHSAQDGWVDQHASPLGKRRHLEAVRRGDLPAVKEGRLRLVRQRDLDAYLTKRPAQPTPSPDAAFEEGVARILAGGDIGEARERKVAGARTLRRRKA